MILSACANNQSALPTQSQDCQTPLEWKIEFTLSGGIAGLSRSLTISNSGNAIVQDLKKREIHESSLSIDEIEKIAELLAKACPFENERSDISCADCLSYKLFISMNGGQYSLDINDLNIPENTTPIIIYLRSYVTNQ